MTFKQTNDRLRHPKLILCGMVTVGLLLGCQATDNDISEVEYARTQTDLSGLNGKWDIYYTIPDSRTYSIPLVINIEGQTLTDGNGRDQADQKSLASLTQMSVNGKWVNFRWKLNNQTEGEEGAIWDYKFTGEYRTDEYGERFLEGSVTGFEVDIRCLHPVANLKNVERKADGSCPSEEVSGTWKGKPFQE